MQQVAVIYGIDERVEPGRAADTAVTRADTTKLRTATGWEPQHDLDRTLRDVLDYWRGVAAMRNDE